MLLNGVTRDIFLLACDPKLSEIRNIVISGFAELGKIKNMDGSGSVYQSCDGSTTLKKI